MNKINGYAGPAMQTGANAIAGMPLLTMLMQKFNMTLPGNPTASGSAAGAMDTVAGNASGATGQPLDTMRAGRAERSTSPLRRARP